MSANCGIEAVLRAVRAGRPVIVVDSEERENEGDLFVAAQRMTPAAIHFLISEGRGQLCVPIASKVARRLGIRPIVERGADLSRPAFAVPLDHRSVRTGASPVDRAATIRALADPNSGAGDFVRPGHVFPLIADDRGLAGRQGHTEAAVELARLAGLEPVGVLCEVCSRDGRGMAGRLELSVLAARFNLEIVTIDHLIAMRIGNGVTLVDHPRRKVTSSE